MKLNEQKCEACQIDAPQVSAEQLPQLFMQVPEWQLPVRENIRQLEREFHFANFKQAWSFCDQVAQLAETENHHPSILLEWGKVTVTWWTHKIKGLHHNDFIMAAKTDALYAGQSLGETLGG